MRSRIVVGFDGTEPSRAALAWALEQGRPVLVAHVADSDSGIMGADYRRAVEQTGGDLLDRTLAEVAVRHPEAEVDTVLLDGPVAWALARCAEADDILAIGTHKTGFLHGRVLGSRSVEVAVLAECDVMVVPTTDMRFRTGVVAGVADDGSLRAVVEAAVRAAASRAEELLLVHGTGDDEHGDRSPLAEAVAIAREMDGDVVIRSRSSNRRTAELLLDAARDRALLVLGSGSADRDRNPIGSVLHDVLLNLTAPVLVAHHASTRVPVPDEARQPDA